MSPHGVARRRRRRLATSDWRRTVEAGLRHFRADVALIGRRRIEDEDPELVALATRCCARAIVCPSAMGQVSPPAV